MALGEAYLALGSVSMLAEAQAEFQQAVHLDPDLLWARFFLAKVYFESERNERAKEELERGLEIEPDVSHFLTLLGEVNRRLGDPEASLELNRRALEVDPHNSPALYYRALAFLDQGKEDDAIRELEQAIGSEFVAPSMYLKLGSLYAQRKEYPAAEELVRKAIELDPSQPVAFLNLAEIHNARGESDKALQALKLALPEGKAFPASPYYQGLQADVFFETGRAHQAKGRTREAVEAYLATLRFDPTRGDAHRRLAELFLRRGDRRRALEHAETAATLGTPVDPFLRERILRGEEEETRSSPLVP
jgi:protein O-GlcNAc transferase